MSAASCTCLPQISNCGSSFIVSSSSTRLSWVLGRGDSTSCSETGPVSSFIGGGLLSWWGSSPCASNVPGSCPGVGSSTPLPLSTTTSLVFSLFFSPPEGSSTRTSPDFIDLDAKSSLAVKRGSCCPGCPGRASP